MDDLQWGRICNVGDLRENTRNSIGRFVTWVNLEWGQIVTWRRLGMRVNCNMANLKWGQIWNGDEFEMWVICNMGELHHILRCASSRTLPLQRTQKNLSHARDVFLCVYTHIYTYLHDICQRSDNTRVGANCNSPFHMGEL